MTTTNRSGYSYDTNHGINPLPARLEAWIDSKGEPAPPLCAACRQPLLTAWDRQWKVHKQPAGQHEPYQDCYDRYMEQN